MKNKRRIRRWIKKRKFWLILFAILLSFPVIIGAIYALPLPQLIAIDSGDLIAYYGTVFGILGSFITYRHEVKMKEKERNQQLKPLFFVDVSLVDSTVGVFQVNIYNQSKQALSYFQFYDVYVSSMVKKNYSFKVTYNKTIAEENQINPTYNITMDSEIIDSDGYPKYIQLICDDEDGNQWDCCYYKVKDGAKIYYYPRDFEII